MASLLACPRPLTALLAWALHSVGMYKEDDLQGLQVYINGINSRVYALDIVEKKRDPGRRMSGAWGRPLLQARFARARVGG